MASEAKELAKARLGKLGATVSKAVDKIVQPKPNPNRNRGVALSVGTSPEKTSTPHPISAVALSAVCWARLSAASSTLWEPKLEKPKERAQDIQERVTLIIEGSPKLRDRLGGGVRCLSPVSQASSMQSINGRMTQTVTLMVPDTSSRGQAMAEVQYYDNEGRDDLTVVVRLPNGEKVDLSNGGGGGESGFKTIDVEWKSPGLKRLLSLYAILHVAVCCNEEIVMAGRAQGSVSYCRWPRQEAWSWHDSSGLGHCLERNARLL